MHTVDKECEETSKLMCEVGWQHENDAAIAEAMEHANRVLALVDAELESDKVCELAVILDTIFIPSAILIPLAPNTWFSCF